jgi:hypothetical protein
MGLADLAGSRTSNLLGAAPAEAFEKEVGTPAQGWPTEFECPSCDERLRAMPLLEHARGEESAEVKVGVGPSRRAKSLNSSNAHAVVRGGRIRRRWSSDTRGRRIGLGLPSPGFA